MRKQTKIAAIVSAAALLAIGASMTSFAMWRETVEGSDEWAYYDRYWEIDMSEGWHRGEEGWTHGPESWYFADENGIMKRDELFEFEDNLYYVHPDGHRAENEWVAVDADDDVEMADERVSFDVVYYYFNSTGKAIKAKDGGYEAIKLKKDNGVDAAGTFVFNGDGVMQIGRVPNVGDDNDTYYCVQKYDSLSITLSSKVKGWPYVTGEALTGWAKMDTEAIVEDAQLAREDYDDQEWFYFDKGKLVTNNTAKIIDGKYYAFDSAGVMISGNTDVGLATASNAKFPEEQPDVYVYADGDGLASTGNRFVNFQDLDWYYIVNIRDEDTRELVGLQKGDGAGKGRAVIFNKQKKEKSSDPVKTADLDQYPSRMISVGGKRFMIGADGVMITGAYKITEADVKAWTKDEGGNIDGKAKWNGIDYVIPTYEDKNDKTLHIVEAGNYLYFDDSEDLDGDRGELTVGRVTYDDGDDGTITRFFTANGKVDEWAIYGDYLYHEGLLYTSEDGDRYELVSIENRVLEDNGDGGNKLADGTVLKSGGADGYLWRYKLKANVPNKDGDKPLQPAASQKVKDTYLIVDYNGRVQKGYTSRAKIITIDDGTRYDVTNYVATEHVDE